MATHYAIKEQDVINNLDNRLLSGLNKSTIEKIMNIILESLESDTRIVIKENFLKKKIN